jgi:hypothetical protein
MYQHAQEQAAANGSTDGSGASTDGAGAEEEEDVVDAEVVNEGE